MTSPSTDRRLGLTGDKAYKAPVTAATIANITLYGEQTIDGVAVLAINAAGYPDRVLVKNQTNTVENGIWDVSTAAWTRSLDCNTTQDLVNGTQMLVPHGTTQATLVYTITGTNPIIPGVSAITFTVQTLNGAQLASSSGASLVGYIQGSSGTIATTVQAKLRERVDLFDFLSAAQIADATTGVVPTLDVTTAFQTAISSSAGKALFIPDGARLLITSSLVVTNFLTIKANRYLTTIYLGTQNQNGIVIGNGTSGGNTTASKTIIEGLAFNVLPGVAASTSGSCIYRSYVSSCIIRDCDFYGTDANSSTTKLYRGVTDSSVILSTASECTFANLLGNGINVSGTSTILPSSTNRYDNNLFSGISLDAVYIGLNTEGMTLNQMISYLVQGYAIHINAVSSTQGQNYFINQPDFEIDGTGGGIYVEGGQRVQVVGGWIGAGTPSAGVPVGVWFGVNSNTCTLNNTGVTGSVIQIDGPANALVGAEISGDASTTTVGINVTAAAVDTLIDVCRIRQFTNYGIVFTGNPVRGLVVGCQFRSIGILEITGNTGGLATDAINIRSCQTDANPIYTAAATLTLHAGHEFIQVTGATAITAMTYLGPGATLSVQAGAGGLNWTNGTNLIMKGGVNLVQTQFTVINFVSDGQSWFQTGQNF